MQTIDSFAKISDDSEALAPSEGLTNGTDQKYRKKFKLLLDTVVLAKAAFTFLFFFNRQVITINLK